MKVLIKALLLIFTVVMGGSLLAVSTVDISLEEAVISEAQGHFSLTDTNATGVNDLRFLRIHVTSDNTAGFEVKLTSTNNSKFKLNPSNDDGANIDYTATCHFAPGESVQHSGTITTPPFTLDGPDKKIIDVSNTAGSIDAIFYIHVSIDQNEIRKSFTDAGGPKFADTFTFTIIEK